MHLPFVVRKPHGVARTIYLELAIDACTGYPVGWHLVIGAPREMDSLRCLEMYPTPAKAARFKELGIVHTLNLNGTPAQVIFDNGPETKGGRIVRLELLAMDVKHCKAKEVQGNPDDFRQAYVYEGDDLPLVTLTHEHVRPETPAWTFTEAKARFDSGMDEYTVHDAKVQFLRDLDDAVTGNGKTRKTKPRGNHEEFDYQLIGIQSGWNDKDV